MPASNEPHWEGSTNPRMAARALEILAGLVGTLGLLAGLLLLAQDGERMKGLLIGLCAVGATAIFYVCAVVLRWLSAAYELMARRPAQEAGGSSPHGA